MLALPVSGHRFSAKAVKEKGRPAVTDLPFNVALLMQARELGACWGSPPMLTLLYVNREERIGKQGRFGDACPVLIDSDNDASFDRGVSSGLLESTRPFHPLFFRLD